MSRIYTPIATPEAQKQLNRLLESTGMPEEYKSAMTELGKLLAETVLSNFSEDISKRTIVVSTAEDADFLQCGVSKA